MVRGKVFCEFFAGIGLVHEALQATGWRCVYANDNDPKKSAMYREHFGQADYYHEADVWNTHEVVERIEETPFLATASFPCTDMSLAGRRKGFRGSESSAFFGFLAALDALGERRPPLLMLENVVGFLNSHGGQDFQTAVEALRDRGYGVDAMVLDAKDFLPQSRPRLFVFGFHQSLRSPLVIRSNGQLFHDPWLRAVDAAPRLRPPRLRAVMDSAVMDSAVMDSAVTDSPLTEREITEREITDSGSAPRWATVVLPSPRPARYQLIDAIDLDDQQDWWDAEMVDKHYRMMSDDHRRRVDGWLHDGELHVATIYRRIRQGVQRAEVRFDGVAGCLRTPRGGSARQIVLSVAAGGLRMRWMSPREYARLQGAPDYTINQRTHQALFGFGDAVCVPVIRWIDRHLLTPVFQSVAGPAERVPHG